MAGALVLSDLPWALGFVAGVAADADGFAAKLLLGLLNGLVTTAGAPDDFPANGFVFSLLCVLARLAELAGFDGTSPEDCPSGLVAGTPGFGWAIRFDTGFPEFPELANALRPFPSPRPNDC